MLPKLVLNFIHVECTLDATDLSLFNDGVWRLGLPIDLEMSDILTFSEDDLFDITEFLDD